MPLFLPPPPPQKKGVILRFVSFDELYHLWYFRVRGPIFSVWMRCRRLPGSFTFSSPKTLKKEGLFHNAIFN